MSDSDTDKLADVVAYGTVALDNIVRLPALPGARGRIEVTADYYRLGGEALNVALPLGAWGHHVAVAGNRLGEDPHADFIRRELERHPRVDGSRIEQSPRVRTPFSRILVTPDGEPHLLDYWLGEAQYIPLEPAHLAGARLFTTDAHGGEERVEAARVAHEAGLTIVSADVIWPEHGLLALSDWILFSRAFLERHLPGTDLKAHLQELGRRCRATFIVTDGPRALSILTPERDWRELPPYPFAALDRLGAGSLFRAGIIHGILEGMELIETARFANAAAALWVVQPAALKQPPTVEQICALQEERAQPLTSDWPRSGATSCPICRRVVAASLFEKHWEMEERVVRALRARHPAWRRAEGACPNCVHEVVRQLGQRRAVGSIPSEVADHPIYGQGEPYALPTAVRLRANPHYAGRGVVLAFIDSGFYPHPDLTQSENRIIDFVDASTEEIRLGADFSVPHPSSWHGTMTSVVAAGNGFLSGGDYAGLAREARLLLIKASTPEGRIDEKDLLRALSWLAERWREYGVQVLNLSVGGDEGLRPNSKLNRLVNRLVGEGLVVVAAAGNAGQNDLRPPASAAAAITVGGLDDRNTLDPSTDRIWHSNWGRINEQTLKPELIAPSIWLAAPVLPGTPTAEQNQILESLRRADTDSLRELVAARLHDLDLDPDLLDKPGEALRLAILQKLIANKFISPFYQHVDGTSFAAPIVSSVVAQMLEANPSLTPRRVKELLIATARPLPDVPEYRQGYGVVMPGQAVAAALHELRGRYEPGRLSPQVQRDRVRFILHEPRARHASVIGEWNDWNPAALPMVEREPGVWVAEMERLPRGRYRYKFLIDNQRWLDDPENRHKAVDGYGGFDALLLLD